MTWLDALLILAVLAGLFAGAVLVAQRPQFWLGMFLAILRKLKPQLIAALIFLTKRMPPEQEKAWRDCIKRGGEWDHVRKRCK